MILVSSVGGCATTMLMKYLIETLPQQSRPVEFTWNEEVTTGTERIQLASSLYAANYSAYRVGERLLKAAKQDPSIGDDFERWRHTPGIAEAFGAVYLNLKHACHPPLRTITEANRPPKAAMPWDMGEGYGLLDDVTYEPVLLPGEYAPAGIYMGGLAYFSTSEDVQITKAIYLHADPIDVISTLSLKGPNGEGTALRDHIIKCSPYPYELLMSTIFPALAPQDVLCTNQMCTHQVDPFGFEYSFDRWTNPDDRGYPTLVVKYETMWNNLPAIAEFLELDEYSFIAGFPKKRERKRPGTDFPEAMYTNLRRLYSSLITKRSQIPDIMILR